MSIFITRRQKRGLHDPLLLEQLDLDAQVFSYLRKYNVFTSVCIEDLQAKTPPSAQKSDLVDKIRTQRQYRGFILTLKETNQTGIVRNILLEDPDLFTATQDLAEDREGEAPTQFVVGQDGGALFPRLCQHYIDELSLAPAYDYSTRTQRYNLKDTFTEQTIKTLHSHHDDPLLAGFGKSATAASISGAAAATILGGLAYGAAAAATFSVLVPSFTNTMASVFQKKESVSTLAGVFANKKSEGTSVLAEGHPGSGKTTFIHYCVLSWAEACLLHAPTDQDGQSHPHLCKELMKHKLVLLIRPKDENYTLMSTIEETLKSIEESERGKCLELFQDCPESCLLIVEGLDEFQNEAVIKEIFDLMKAMKTNVVISCRVGNHQSISERSSFTKIVEITGFQPRDTKNFIVNYLKSVTWHDREMGREKGRRLAPLLELDQQHKFLNTPMNAVLLCLAYIEGDLTDDDVRHLSSFKLYGKHFNGILDRECERQARILINQRKELHLAEVKKGLRTKAESTAQIIYRLALQSISEGRKQYTPQVLEDLGIDLQSPGMVLLERVTSGTSGGQVINYTWSHETFQEFHAAQAIEDETALISIAAKQKFKEVVRFLIPRLSESNPQKARQLLNAVLLLQSTTLPCLERSIRNYFTNRNHPCPAIERAKEEQLNIVSLFQNETLTHTELPQVSELLPCITAAWVCANGHFPPEDNLLRTIEGHIAVCPSEEARSDLYRAVAESLLPAKSTDIVWMVSSRNPTRNTFTDIFMRNLTFQHSSRIELHGVRGKQTIMRLFFASPGLLHDVWAYFSSRTKSGRVEVSTDHLEDIILMKNVLREFSSRNKRSPKVVQVDVNGGETVRVREEEGWKQDQMREVLYTLKDIFNPEEMRLNTDLTKDWLTTEDCQRLRVGGETSVCLQTSQNLPP